MNNIQFADSVKKTLQYAGEKKIKTGNIPFEEKKYGF